MYAGVVNSSCFNTAHSSAVSNIAIASVLSCLPLPAAYSGSGIGCVNLRGRHWPCLPYTAILGFEG